MSTSAANPPLFSNLYCGEAGLDFQKALFPSSAPRLTTVVLDGMHPASRFHPPAFASVTALALHDLKLHHGEIPGTNPSYQLYSDFLMALPALTHLELRLRVFSVTPSCLPIALPTLQFLKVEAYDDDADDLLSALSLFNSRRIVGGFIASTARLSKAVPGMQNTYGDQFPCIAPLAYWLQHSPTTSYARCPVPQHWAVDCRSPRPIQCCQFIRHHRFG